MVYFKQALIKCLAAGSEQRNINWSLENKGNNSKVYVERLKTQNSQHNVNEEEQSQRTDTNQLQGLL